MQLSINVSTYLRIYLCNNLVRLCLLQAQPESEQEIKWNLSSNQYCRGLEILTDEHFTATQGV